MNNLDISTGYPVLEHYLGILAIEGQYSDQLLKTKINILMSTWAEKWQVSLRTINKQDLRNDFQLRIMLFVIQAIDPDSQNMDSFHALCFITAEYQY